MFLKIGPNVYSTAGPAEAAISMKLFSIIIRMDCTFKQKKRNLRKYSLDFFLIFKKKSYLAYQL